MGARNRDRLVPHRPTLKDILRLDGHLLGYCADCRHQKVLPLTPLLRQFGDDTAVGDVARRLVCKMCGSKSVRVEFKVSR